MKRDAGWATALVAVATAVGVSSISSRGGNEPQTSGNAVEVPSRPAVHAGSPFYKGPCHELKDLLTVVLGGKEESFPAPDSCVVRPPEPSDQPAVGMASPSGAVAKANASTSTKDGSAATNQPVAPAALPQARFIIASLPDPLHTHLSLVFDDVTAAIQQAAQDSRYTYDSSWLPWEIETSEHPLILDQDIADDRKERLEDQPGVLIFRRSVSGEQEHPYKPKKGSEAKEYKDLLFVFVVGEEPTRGIHREQFRNAAKWIQSLQLFARPSKPVQILGPMFSGSLPSLDQLLHEPELQHALRPSSKEGLEIYSGYVTNNLGVNWFLEQASKPELSDLRIKFLSFQQDDKSVLERYYQYLDAIGIGTCNLALISEDETAYGFAFDPTTRDEKPEDAIDDSQDQHHCSQDPISKRMPPTFYYPRDISALRAAYQEQAMFSKAAASEGSAEGARHTLKTDLADPEGKDHDTIRSFGGSQTALSEEAILLQIVSMLRAHHSEFLMLRGSNPLDQLFLAHFFKLTYPEGRIIFSGNDLLLRREVGSAGLTGAMTLSPYPLLPQIDDWTTSKRLRHSHRAFPEDGALGIYMALRFLLKPLKDEDGYTAVDQCINQQASPSGFLPPNQQSGLTLPDYSGPFWGRNPFCRPAIWLSVLGHDGFWPVASLDGSSPTVPPSPLILPLRPFLIYQAGSVWNHLKTAPLTVWNSIAANAKDLLCPESSSGPSRGQCFGTDQRSIAEQKADRWRAMPLSMDVALVLLLLWALFHVFCCCGPAITVKPDHRSYFVRPRKVMLCPSPAEASMVQKSQHPKSHIALIVSASALLVTVCTVLAEGYGWMSDQHLPVENPFIYTLIPVLVWLLGGLAVAGNAFVEHWMKLGKGDRISLRALMLPSRNSVANPKTAQLRRATLKAMTKPLAIFVLLTAFFYCFYLLDVDSFLTPEVRYPSYLRAMNLTTGVSPVIPLVLLALGMYGWCWYALRGLALFGADRPLLPLDKHLRIKVKGEAKPKSLLVPLSAQGAAKPMERYCWPFQKRTLLVAGLLFVVICVGSSFLSGGVPLRSLGSERYTILVCVWVAISMSVLLANALQLVHLWLRLQSLLVFLDRLPLRRTLQSMRGFTWSSIWKIGGNVVDLRYKLFYREFEALNHLQAAFDSKRSLTQEEAAEAASWGRRLEATRPMRIEFATWYAESWDDWTARDLGSLQRVQKVLAHLAGILLTDLLVPKWRMEEESLLVPVPPRGEAREDEGAQMLEMVAGLPSHVKHAEEIVCLVYLGFIQNILGRMRTLVMGMVCLYLSIALVVPSYPFDPRPVLAGAVIFLFVVVGVVVFVVYSQMFRDGTLSHLTNTKPGELGPDFWLKFMSFGIGPIFGLIATVFPEVSDFVLSWVQPNLSSLK